MAAGELDQSAEKVRPSSDASLELHESELSGRSVLITPLDEDRFIVRGESVIRACNLTINAQLWWDELVAAMEEVSAWSHLRQGKLRDVVCDVGSAKVRFYFSTSGKQYDFDLADELTDLELKLHREFNLGYVEVMQIPHDAMNRFAGDDARIVIWPRNLDV